MFSILLSLIFNPWALYGALGLLLIGVGIYFTLGPAALIKIALDLRTWFVIALVLAVLAFAHSEQRANDLEQKIETAQEQATASADGQKTSDLRVRQKTKRQQETTRLQESIDHAPPGQAEDALLDAIAAERPDLNPAPDHDDGLRKHVDGVVVP